ncbi:MAG: amidohydrolase [candidate division Zixibacteria bacterium]|nr:amidohydrolase [candidate division Zixibacteria bacterium]
MIQHLELRKQLHSQPELSGQEENTSQVIHTLIKSYKPDNIITGIGGFGIAAVFDGKQSGPKVMIRCELDALPIPETLDIPYRSEVRGVSHKCGHDGHMTIVAGLAEYLHANQPARGSVILLFQPAEETGEGAEKVINDVNFQHIQPDFVIALHNLPGYPLGQVVTRKGVFASASSGLRIHLQGKTSHAAEPEAGNSPALAVAQLIQVLSSIPQFHTSLHEPAQVTVIHARLGDVAFGTSPGEGDVMITLRSHSQDVIESLIEKAISIAKSSSDMFGLKVTIDSTELFPPTNNNADIVSLIEESASETGLSIHQRDIPFAWSEDFGHFTSKYKGALFGIGAGENHPALHHPDYDFPDDLIQPGINMFSEIITRLLSNNEN